MIDKEKSNIRADRGKMEKLIKYNTSQVTWNNPLFFSINDREHRQKTFAMLVGFWPLKG